MVGIQPPYYAGRYTMVGIQPPYHARTVPPWVYLTLPCTPLMHAATQWSVGCTVMKPWALTWE